MNMLLVFGAGVVVGAVAVGLVAKNNLEKAIKAKVAAKLQEKVDDLNGGN